MSRLSDFLSPPLVSRITISSTNQVAAPLFLVFQDVTKGSEIDRLR